MRFFFQYATLFVFIFLLPGSDSTNLCTLSGMDADPRIVICINSPTVCEVFHKLNYVHEYTTTGTCGDFCRRKFGMACDNGWHESGGGCTRAGHLGCWNRGGSTDDHICRCKGPITTPAPTPTPAPTASPTAPTAAPTDPTATPTAPTASPTAPTAAPTAPTAAPTAPTAAPTAPTAAPTAPTAAPTAPTAAPTAPTPAPTGCTSPPIKCPDGSELLPVFALGCDYPPCPQGCTSPPIKCPDGSELLPVFALGCDYPPCPQEIPTIAFFPSNRTQSPTQATLAQFVGAASSKSNVWASLTCIVFALAYFN